MLFATDSGNLAAVASIYSCTRTAARQRSQRGRLVGGAHVLGAGALMVRLLHVNTRSTTDILAQVYKTPRNATKS